MKVRYVLLVISALIILYWGTMLLEDLYYIDSAVTSVQRTVSTAAEMALSQVVASDEMFNNGAGGTLYNEDGITTVYIADGNTQAYTRQNLFETVYGTTDKALLYNCMYGQNSLFNNTAYIEQIKQITQEVGDYELPVFLRMGLLDGRYNLIPNTRSVVTDILNGTGYTASVVKFGSDWLGTTSIEKKYTDSHKRSYSYYLAPTNVGLTYIDPNLLETAFVCNMDVLMRSQFVATGSDLSVGVGVPESLAKGTDFVITDEAQETAVSYNIINNGTFGFVKGTRTAGNTTGGGYTGGVTEAGTAIRPVIEYKVVNMCDPANAQLVRLAVTDRAGERSASTYTDWLIELGIDPSVPHYCVVAKITFYADIVIPYKTALSRNLYTLYTRNNADAVTDFFQVVIDDTTTPTNNSTCISQITGNPLYAYTVYYAVVP